MAIKTVLFSVAAFGLVIAGCGAPDGAEEREPSAEVGQTSASVVGGIPVSAPLFDAIGAIVQRAGDGSLHPFCSGTLVAKDGVLTARHCLLTVPPGETVYFAVGPDARAPRALVPIVSMTWDRDVRGGAMGLGSDTAIAHLAPGVLRGVAPLATSTLGPRDEGRRFVTVGYGLQALRDPNAPAAALPSGTRRAGVLDLASLAGNVYELTYGSFEGFVAAVLASHGMAGVELPAEDLALLREAYAGPRLLPGYEAFFGGGPRDAMTSQGDSGGPVLALRGGRFEVVAVTSGSLAVDANVRDPASRGGIYATLGPEARHLIASVGTCGGLSEWGTCTPSGTAARCSDLGEGAARRIERACPTRALSCVAGPAGPTCAPPCSDDTACAAIAPGGVCVAGQCKLPRDCAAEGDSFAAFLCCLGEHATSPAEAERCVGALAGARALASPLLPRTPRLATR